MAVNVALLLILAVYFPWKSVTANENIFATTPVVETNYGLLKGFDGLSRDGRAYFGFLGIPYAEPPIGNLRYESPRKPQKWHGVRDATHYRAKCAQIDIFGGGKQSGSEDCLFLNVFTHAVNPTDKLKPTLVFIHGGVFMVGSSDTFLPEYFMDEDVVLVTINYRLASFGFLSTGVDGLVRGNMGLKDQVIALKYIQENIAKFGGDPNRVTVSGQSAGGVCAHHLLLSPNTLGLFQGGISQSGLALSSNSWAAHPDDPLKQAMRYANNANCAINDTKIMIECLKGLTTAQLLDAHIESTTKLKDPITLFTPTIETVPDEDAFLTEHPTEILRLGKAHRLPWITGYNSEEGLLAVARAGLADNQDMLKKFNEDYFQVMPVFIRFDQSIGKSRTRDIMAQARDFYFGVDERIDSIKKLQNFTNIGTDSLWQHQLQHIALIQGQFSPVWAYYYSYKGSYNGAQIMMGDAEKNQHGPSHGDELALLFPKKGAQFIYPQNKKYAMSKELVKVWVSFANYNDEEPIKFQGQEWMPIKKDATSVEYLEINERSKMIEQPNSERVEFWKKALSDQQQN